MSHLAISGKVGCIFPRRLYTAPAELGQNDNRNDPPHFISGQKCLLTQRIHCAYREKYNVIA